MSSFKPGVKTIQEIACTQCGKAPGQPPRESYWTDKERGPACSCSSADWHKIEWSSAAKDLVDTYRASEAALNRFKSNPVTGVQELNQDVKGKQLLCEFKNDTYSIYFSDEKLNSPPSPKRL